INHNGRWSYYTHLATIDVPDNSWVDENTIIGTVGTTGLAAEGCWPHLHYETRASEVQSGAINPGELRGCLNGTSVSWPAASGLQTWAAYPGVSASRLTITNEGTGCGGVAAPVSEGDFIKIAGRPEVFRLVGGAPIYVSNWANIGGEKPVKTLSQAQFDALRSTPADGTYVTGAPGGRVFVFAGGAPLYVSNWANVGGGKPTTVVDEAALTHAGRSYPWNFVRSSPADGTYLRAGVSGPYYLVGAGAAEVVE
ncbi:MAG: M23 family metallopeptidase, partial [Propionibacteriaceae bacterium]|nr:M23 family metallopeptidase [Propionibacteriaceae bacterium]